MLQSKTFEPQWPSELLPTSKAIIQYWQSKRGAGINSIPDSFATLLEGVDESLMGWAFMSEISDGKLARVLYSGADLDKIIGTDIAGSDVYDLIPEATLDIELDYFKTITAKPCCGSLVRVLEHWRGTGKPLCYRTIHMPVLDTNGEIKYLFGAGEDMGEGYYTHERKDTVATRFIDLNFAPVSR